MEYKENFKLSQNELILIFDALSLWLDSVTPYDFNYADEPQKKYEKQKKAVEQLKKDIHMAILPF